VTLRRVGLVKGNAAQCARLLPGMLRSAESGSDRVFRFSRRARNYGDRSRVSSHSRPSLHSSAPHEEI